MNRNSILVKSMSYGILVTVFYMHFCSVMCALSVCSGKDNRMTENCGKSCCREKKSKSAEGCQSLHLSFFSTTGKTFVDGGNLLSKVQEYTVISLAIFSAPLQTLPDGHCISYNIFHPPRKVPDIRISIQSFQI
jgi:hypothetical protein